MSDTQRTARARFGPARIGSALVLAVAIAATPLVAQSAAADTVDCTDEGCDPLYSQWVSVMGPDRPPSPLPGFWGAYTGHNCTGYAAWRLITNGTPKPSPRPGGAGDWASLAIEGHYLVDGTPAVGSIAQWDSGSPYSSGHVAYVEKVTPTQIQVSEDTYSKELPFRKRTINRNSGSWPDNFIHYNDVVPAPEGPSIANAYWKLSNALNTPKDPAYSPRFGTAGDIPVKGDWDGDGDETAGVVRDGEWILTNDANPTTAVPAGDRFDFGQATDVPVVGDWDGDGIDTFGVVRNGKNWIVTNATFASHLAGSYTTQRVLDFGNKDLDTPIVGDWDGDGVDTAGLRRLTGWIVTDTPFTAASIPEFDAADIVRLNGFGKSTDTPIVGDWNGDGVDTFGVWRAGEFILTNDSVDPLNINAVLAVATRFDYGASTDNPLAGDWNGDGFDTQGVVN